MSNKFREFWVKQFNGHVPATYTVAINRPEEFNNIIFKINGDEISSLFEYFHVIEYSAYEAEQAKVKKLVEALKYIKNNEVIMDDITYCVYAEQALKEVGEL